MGESYIRDAENAALPESHYIDKYERAMSRRLKELKKIAIKLGVDPSKITEVEAMPRGTWVFEAQEHDCKRGRTDEDGHDARALLAYIRLIREAEGDPNYWAWDADAQLEAPPDVVLQVVTTVRRPHTHQCIWLCLICPRSLSTRFVFQSAPG